MNTRTKILIVTIGPVVITFLTNPNGPLGSFWAPPPDFPAPTSAQVPFFIVLSLAESIAFGLGASFLIFGAPLVRAIGSASPALSRAAHLSIAWLLINWWPHESCHNRSFRVRSYRVVINLKAGIMGGIE